MAISGGNYRVENDLQQSFSSDMSGKGDTISSVIGDYNSSNDSTIGNAFWDGVLDWGSGGLYSYFLDGSQNSHDFVGITPDMLSKITGAIDSYSSNLTSILDGMPEAVDYTQGFKGTGVETAVKNFVTTVKEVCKSYLESLKLAENQIIESVNAQYAASDQDIAGQLNSDSSAISK